MASKNKKWTLEACKASALKYKSIKEWSVLDANGYGAAWRHGWLPICTAQMPPRKRKWTLEACKESSLKYNGRYEWSQNDNNAYNSAQINGWLDFCCEHMKGVKQKKRTLRKWTLELCKASALQYLSISEWKNASSAYSAALRNNWVQKCTAHMSPSIETRKRKWTLDACKGSALQYDTRNEWIIGCVGAANSARRKGWWVQCTGHMRVIKKTDLRKWSFEKCLGSALKHTSRQEWRVNDKNAYLAAKKYNWFDDCVERMGEINITNLNINAR